MPPRITPMSFRQVDRLLRRHGFRPTRQRGSHVFYQDRDGRATVVPRHDGGRIPPGLVRAIFKKAGLDLDDLRR